jgi:hypothetical protein
MSIFPSSKKAERERRIFREFVDRSGLPNDLNTIEGRKPPEPDIYCIHAEDGPLAFELVELCNAVLARMPQTRLSAGSDPDFI